MKAIILLIFCFSVSVSFGAPPQALPAKSAKTPSSQKTSADPITKSPKAIFLIKRAKIDSEIGEPVLHPFDKQMSNIYYDLPGGAIRND